MRLLTSVAGVLQDYDPVEGTSLVLTMAQSMITNILEVRDRLNIPSLSMRIGTHSLYPPSPFPFLYRDAGRFALE